MFRNFIAAILLVLTLATPLLGCSSPAAPTATPSQKAPSSATSQPATPAANAKPANPQLILATTTSTQDSGLLDVLVPMFEKQTGYDVKTIAVGTGQALAMGERAEADVLLVHAPDSEKKFMQAGHGAERKLVMHNDFIIVGPPADPAKIKGVKTADEALKKIVAAKALFVSRGDNSGTEQLEKKLWKQTGLDPKGQDWYKQTGQGMGATLNVASDKNGYTISDRATYLATKKNHSLDILVEADKALLNIYHVITVNPQKSPKINVAGAKAFEEFMVAPDTQAVVGKFGADKFGQPLFFADAGKQDN
ncbi:MAG: substrate-binding domain-containing protein [Chloroflexi bacterium]|nr:substrate-binding domain-containing protein [Chloroflexota bacterium]